jgi:hydroxypyruvate isomerase
MDRAGTDNLKLQYDIHHAQVMEGDLGTTLATQSDRIGHIPLTDNPGRRESGTGEIKYDFLFGRSDAIGYQGFLGCAYKPLKSTTNCPAWLNRHLAAS